MLVYYFKLAIRRILKNPVFSAINMIALAIGITSFYILFIYVVNEKSFDKHFADYKRIYRVISTPVDSDTPWARSLGFINGASSNMPEVEDATQFTHCPLGTIKIKDESFQQEDIMSIDGSFVEMFAVESIVGDLAEISEPNTAFITEDFAKKQFNNENPVGKIIKIESLQYMRDVGEFQIRGVVKNTHQKSHFTYQILLSQKGALEERYLSLPNLKIHWVYNYLKLKNDVSPNSVAEKLQNNYNESSLHQARGPQEYAFSLIPLADIHLKTDYRFELKESTSKINISLFIIISFVILFISLLNFINLNFAKLIKRSKEFEINRTFGAYKRQLTGQVLVETLILCSIAIVISLFFIELVKPFLKQLFEIDFSIYYSEPIIYICIIGVLAICSALSAFFVAFFLFGKSSTINIHSEKTVYSGNFVLKLLFVLQTTIVIILISSTFLVNKQINFISSKSLGFDKDNVIVIHLKDFSKDPAVFANELKKQSQITSVGFTNQYFGYPTQSIPLEDFGIEGSAEFVLANYDYVKTMNIQLIHNWITPSIDTIEGLIINEHLYHRLLEKHGSIESLEAFRDNQNTESNNVRMKFIGVAKDFNYNSAHESVGDFAFLVGESPYRARFIHVRINPGDLRTTLHTMKEIWNTHYNGQEFSYFFINEKIAQQYKAETILRRILSAFSILGILISIIGISALALFISQQRTKEIGIRKVNGAKINEILIMLNKEFVRWVGIAFVIACPIAYYLMNKWMENFAYKTTLSWWIFALAGLIAMFIVLVTVSLHSWRAAAKNPIEALKYE